MQVAELKQANNLISDQEFYALSAIKIPVLKGSIREEMVLNENTKTGIMENCFNERQSLSDDNSDWENDIYSGNEEKRQLLWNNKVSSTHVTTTAPHPIGDDFFKRIDENVQSVTLSANLQERRVEDVVSQLTSATASLPECSWPGSQNSRNNAQSWCFAIIAAVCVAVILPIIVFVYMFL